MPWVTLSVSSSTETSSPTAQPVDAPFYVDGEDVNFNTQESRALLATSLFTDILMPLDPRNLVSAMVMLCSKMPNAQTSKT